MIEEQALVISTTGEYATLEIIRQKACGICGQTRGCGNATWGKIFAHHSVTFSARNSIDAKPGDYVIIGVADYAILKSAFLLYIIPLTSMLIGATICQYVLAITNDFLVLLAAFFGLALGFLLTKHHVASKKYTSENEPIILRQNKENSVY